MIKVCYSELDGPKGLSLRLEAAGHAGYAPAGQDIVCAGASTLMQALVYLLAGEESARSDAWDEPEGPRLAVAAQAPVAPWVQGAFELAKAGFTLLAERYPDNLRFADVSRSGQQSMMDLQLFAEGGDGAAAAGGDGAAPAAAEKAASAPAQGKGREAAAAEVDEMLSPAEEPGAEEDAAEGEEQDGAEDKSSTDPEAHRKAFGELMRGEYNREFGEMIVQATQKAYDSILNEQGPVGRILNALGQKYGTAPGDYEALAAAVEGGVVKDDAYYEDMAMKKGISVQLAKEMDALESENAKHRAAEQQRAEAAKMEAIQQEWDAAAERIRAEDPGFDIKTALADPDFAQMLKLGVKMEDAYKARYFDDIMARRTTQTAKTVEKGVEARIRQRGARPAENGTNPGGAAVLKTDVSKLTPAQCEELERRAMRGQIITF